MSVPKVSVIVPVYNVEKYISECVESLIFQTLYDIEIVLIDNGSKDSSSNIIRAYAEKDERIKIYKIEVNRGMPRARNLGIKKASGEYISFVDSDDLCDLTMFEKMYNQAKELDSDIVTCNVLRFYKDWKKGEAHHPSVWYSQCHRNLDLKNCPEQLMEQAAWAKILRRDYIEKLDYYFTEDSICCEDVPAFTRAFINTKKISIVNECLYYYRNRPDSLSNNTNRKYLIDFLYAMDIQDNLFIEKNINDLQIMAIKARMRLLLANHILQKLVRKDKKFFYQNVAKAFDKDDIKYLEPFLVGIPFTGKLIKLIKEQ